MTNLTSKVQRPGTQEEMDVVLRTAAARMTCSRIQCPGRQLTGAAAREGGPGWQSAWVKGTTEAKRPGGLSVTARVGFGVPPRSVCPSVDGYRKQTVDVPLIQNSAVHHTGLPWLASSTVLQRQGAYSQQAIAVRSVNRRATKRARWHNRRPATPSVWLRLPRVSRLRDALGKISKPSLVRSLDFALKPAFPETFPSLTQCVSRVTSRR